MNMSETQIYMVSTRVCCKLEPGLHSGVLSCRGCTLALHNDGAFNLDCQVEWGSAPSLTQIGFSANNFYYSRIIRFSVGLDTLL